MKVSIDTDARSLECDGESMPLYGDRAARIISDIWLKVGWNQKYSYGFTWLGVPIIQLPEDILRYQEAVFALKPDVIVETGIAHGGSAILSASLLRLIGKGRVVAIDIEIRPHNRRRIEAHDLIGMITLIEGSSTEPKVLQEVRAAIKQDQRVLVVLDSNHSYAHVAAELEAYAPLVTPGSYLVATDGVMRDLTDVPRGDKSWRKDNPAQAAIDFAAKHPEFRIETPARAFDETQFAHNLTYWPDAWLKRV
jgi:cephalosporin hydroxylase